MYRFKEKEPKDTVISIRHYLGEKGFSISERWFDSGIANVYSVRIMIDNTNYGSNGKGCTKELALASAYGELIERIGNGILFKNGERQKTCDSGFVYFPDEVICEGNAYIETAGNAIVRHILAQMEDVDQAVMCWDELFPNKVIIPFSCITTCKIEYVPYSMLRVYGSNGMAAGNTFEEAFVQATSEIFERYCMQRVIKERLCPPIIGKDFIECRYPIIWKMISDIEENGDYVVEVRDCGIDTGYPVIATTVICKANGLYSVSFGAHPCLESALERTITELFQGKNLKSLCEGQRKTIARDENANLLSLLKNGVGSYPKEFFCHEYSYKLHDYCDLLFDNNIQMKDYILCLLRQKGLSACSHAIKLGEMVVLHVIIPTLSEVYRFDEFRFRVIRMQRRLKNCLSTLYNLNDIELQTLLEFIDYSRKTPEYDSNLSKSVDPNEFFEYHKTQLLILSSGFFRIKKYDRVLGYLQLLKKFISDQEYGIAKEYLQEVESGNDRFGLYGIVKNKYGKEVADTINCIFDLEMTIKTYFHTNGRKEIGANALLNCIRKIKMDMVVL